MLCVRMLCVHVNFTLWNCVPDLLHRIRSLFCWMDNAQYKCVAEPKIWQCYIVWKNFAPNFGNQWQNFSLNMDDKIDSKRYRKLLPKIFAWSFDFVKMIVYVSIGFMWANIPIQTWNSFQTIFLKILLSTVDSSIYRPLSNFSKNGGIIICSNIVYACMFVNAWTPESYKMSFVFFLLVVAVGQVFTEYRLLADLYNNLFILLGKVSRIYP